MHETPEDLQTLQQILDRSYAQAGKNLRDIHGQGRHLGAAELAARLRGPRWLVVATVSSDQRPFTAQVDGTFYRGRFYFGVNDPCSLKARHLGRNPAISATHVPNDDWVVTVHGTAVRVNVGQNGDAGLHRLLIDEYSQRYGPEWTDEALTSESIYFAIEPVRMFALDLSEARRLQGGAIL